LDVPAYSNDEVRVPLIAEALGYKLERTGLYPEWGQTSINRYFNAKGDLIHPEKIRGELEKTGGRRAFHPVRDRIGKDKLMDWRRFHWITKTQIFGGLNAAIIAKGVFEESNLGDEFSYS